MRVLNNVAHLLGRASEPVVRSASASANQLKVAAVATTVISLLAGLYYLFTRCFANKPVHVAQGSASNDPAVTQVAKNIISPNGGVENNAPILPPEEALESIIYPLEDFDKFISEQVHYQLNDEIEQISEIKDKAEIISALKRLLADQKDPYSKCFVLYPLKLALLKEELTLDFVDAFIDLPALPEDDSMIVESVIRKDLSLEVIQKLYAKLSSDHFRFQFIKEACDGKGNPFSQKEFEKESLLYQYFYEAGSFDEKKNLIHQVNNLTFKEGLVFDLFLSHDNSPQKISQFSEFKIPVQGQFMDPSFDLVAYQASDFESISFIPESVKVFMKFQEALVEEKYDECIQFIPHLNLPMGDRLKYALSDLLLEFRGKEEQFLDQLKNVVGNEFKNFSLLQYLSTLVNDEDIKLALNKLRKDLEMQQDRLEEDLSPIGLEPFEKIYYRDLGKFQKSLSMHLDAGFLFTIHEKVSPLVDPVQKCRMAKKMIQQEISKGNLHNALYLSEMIFEELIESDLSEKVARELVTFPPPLNLCSMINRIEDFRFATLLIHLIPHSYTRFQAALKYFESLKFNLNEEQIEKLDPRLIGMNKIIKAFEEKNFEHFLDDFKSLSSELQLQIYDKVVDRLLEPNSNISHDLRAKFFQEIKAPISIDPHLCVAQKIAESRDLLGYLENSPFALEKLPFNTAQKAKMVAWALIEGNDELEKLMNMKVLSPQELTSSFLENLWEAEKCIKTLTDLNLLPYVSNEQWIMLIEKTRDLKKFSEIAKNSEHLASLIVFHFSKENDVKSKENDVKLTMRIFNLIENPEKRLLYGAFIMEYWGISDKQLLDFYSENKDLLLHFRSDQFLRTLMNRLDELDNDHLPKLLKLLNLTSDQEVKNGILKCALKAVYSRGRDQLLTLMIMYLENKEIKVDNESIEEEVKLFTEKGQFKKLGSIVDALAPPNTSLRDIDQEIREELDISESL